LYVLINDWYAVPVPLKVISINRKHTYHNQSNETSQAENLDQEVKISRKESLTGHKAF